MKIGFGDLKRRADAEDVAITKAEDHVTACVRDYKGHPTKERYERIHRAVEDLSILVDPDGVTKTSRRARAMRARRNG